jgi:nucleoside-diphosphate-sugar epimerase
MSFWNNTRVLVTGGHGFLGHHLVEQLTAQGARVFAPRSRDLDLTHPGDMLAAFQDSEAEIVFHAAADVGGIGYNRIAPADIFRNNTLMAVNALEAARLQPVHKLVMVGSACAYPGQVDGLMSEDSFEAGPMHESVDVYGFSKRALYLGGKAYRKQYGVNSIFLILTNLYGPFDKFDPKESHVVAALVRKFVDAKLAGEPEVVCWGTGRPTREFMYVEDCARAIIRAGEVYEDSAPLNIGVGVGTTIRELAEALHVVTGYAGRVRWDTSMPDGALYKVLDTRRMQAALKPPPPTPLRAGLEKTVAWYEAQHCVAA